MKRLLLLLLPLTAFAQPSVTLTQNWTTNKAYEVFELNFSVSQSGLTNPWTDAQCSATFTPPSGSGNNKTVDCFYYDTNVWKARFSPKEIGAYSFSVSYAQGGTPFTSSGSFTTSGTREGFLRKHPTNNYGLVTEANNNKFFSLGIQQGENDYVLADMTTSGSDGIVDYTFNAVNAAANVHGDTYYSELRASGFNFDRVNGEQVDVKGSLTNLNDGSSGAGKFRGDITHTKNTDQIIQNSFKHNFHIMMTVGFFDPTTWLSSSWTLSGNLQTAWFLWTNYYIARWGAYIDVWELSNELAPTLAYEQAMVTQIHSKDVYRHFITNDPGGSPNQYPDLDLMDPHHYYTDDSLALGATWSASSIDAEKAQYPNVPFIWGELGNKCVSSNVPDNTDKSRVRTWEWIAFTRNMGGIVYWLDGYTQPHPCTGSYLDNLTVDQPVRSLTKVFSDATANFDGAANTLACTPSANSACYMTTSSTQMLGYFQDTASHSATLTGSTATFTSPSAMTGRWINTATGATLSSVSISSGSNTLTIPSYTNDTAFRAWASAALPTPVDLTNTVTVTEQNGSATTNYPVQFARVFKDGEILNYPQALVNCASAGNAAVFTQADVKERYASGYVKHSVISFLIPSLAASASCVVSFVNQALGNNDPLSQADMQSDIFYNFEAAFSLTNGSTITASARAMLNAGDYQLWTSGQVAQTIILGDHGNSLTCNTHPCSKYDIGFDANKSFRPLVHATFWPTLHIVKVRYVGEDSNTETLQDQTYSLSLSVGKTSPSTVYTQGSFTQYGKTRWTVSRNSSTTWTYPVGGQSITVPKQIWLGVGTAPTPIAINPNIAYLSSAFAFPNYDTSQTITGISSYWTRYLSTSHSTIGSVGLYTIDQGAAGARDEIGPYPTWISLLLYTGDARMWEISDVHSELSGAWPNFIREGKSGKIINRGDSGSSGMGKVVSIMGRPTLRTGDLAWSGTAAGDQILGVGTWEKDIGNPAGWRTDAAHGPFPGLPLYLITGDFWHLEQDMSLGSFFAALEPAPYAYERGPTGAEGHFSMIQTRAGAWEMRTLEELAAWTPDSMPEKTYFSTIMSDALCEVQGYYNITATSTCTSGVGASRWTNGRNVLAANWQTGAGNGRTYALPMPMGQIGYARTDMVDTGYGTQDSTILETAISLFEQRYYMYSLGRAKELGFPQAAPILTYTAKTFNQGLTDSNTNPWIVAANGRFPVAPTSDHTEITTWAGIKSMYQTVWQNATNGNPQPSGGWVDAAPPEGYLAQTQAAVSFINNEASGTAAWSWVTANIANSANYTTNPKWALVPHTIASSNPPLITTASPLPGGTVSTPYSQSLAASGDTPITWSVVSGALCGGLTLSTNVISGTPTTSQTCSFTIQASNAAGTNTKAFQITIIPLVVGTGTSLRGVFTGTIKD